MTRLKQGTRKAISDTVHRWSDVVDGAGHRWRGCPMCRACEVLCDECPVYYAGLVGFCRDPGDPEDVLFAACLLAAIYGVEVPPK